MWIYIAENLSKTKFSLSDGHLKTTKQQSWKAIDIISSELDKISSPNNTVIMMVDINVDNLMKSEETRNLKGMIESYSIHRLHLLPNKNTNPSQTSNFFIYTNTNETEISS